MLKKLAYTIAILIALFIGIVLIFSQPDIPVHRLKDTYTDSDSKFLKILNTEVHYKVEGEGEKPILLIHGTGASLHTWDGWVNAMRDSLKLIRLDIPAYGITGPFPDRNYSVEKYIAFLDEFITKLDLDTFAIAGNSFGGYLAWNYTLKHPEKVSSLILVDASGYPSNRKIGVFKLAGNPITASLLKQITPRSFIHKNLKEVYGNDELINDTLIDRYWYMARREGNRQAFVDRVNTVYPDRSHLLPNIEVPTLILWGDQDTWTEVDHALKYDNDIPNSALIMYPGIGHVVMEESPKESAQDVLRFLFRIN